MEWDLEFQEGQGTQPIEYLEDSSNSIITENQSPDVTFRYGLNAYRGCLHGCSYCYARPGHEYLGFNAGLDFETKIVVKPRAAELFREFLSRPRWKPEPIMFSGVTDCYQPAERQFRLTRQCLEVALEFRQPVSIITKNALIIRDLDLLSELSRHSLIGVMISITTLDPQLARDMEPRTSVPQARFRAVKMLAEAGVPVGVMTAPIIPGLNDSELPALLEAAGQAGAITAGYTLLRLPLTVEPVFKEWLERTQPDRADKILGLVRQTRHGKLSNSTFGERMVGDGPIATQINHLFQVFRKKYGLNGKFPPLDCSAFRPPLPKTGQLRLFE